MSEVCRCGHGPGSHAQIGGTWECWMCNCTLYVATKSTAPMTSAVGDAAALTDLLAEHTLLFLDEWADKCRCENWVAESEDNREDIKSHRAHVAEVLAGYVTTARAQALEEAADVLTSTTHMPDQGSEDLDYAARFMRLRARGLYRSTENTWQS